MSYEMIIDAQCAEMRKLCYIKSILKKRKSRKAFSQKNAKSDFYNGVFDRYEYPVLTREHIADMEIRCKS